MHWFTRPDALSAFEDPGVKNAMGRYIAVSMGKTPARFMAARTASVDVDLGADTETLWEEHDRVVSSLNFESSEKATPKRSLLDLKVELAKRMLKECHFCERRCGVDRVAGERGFCGIDVLDAGFQASFCIMGEEACLVPSHTFFFIGCSFYCGYCQDWTISRQTEEGVPVTGGCVG